MVTPSFLPKLERIVAKFGTLPSSYKEAMTYEEQILWIANYLEKEIIPVVQNNAEALEELQNLFTALKNYVDEYFDNLDIETEIDNKLDEMADDGTLAEIIEDYATIPQLTARVTTLEEEVEALGEKEKFLFIGDTYGSMSATSWINKTMALLGDKVDCQKISNAGLGFAHTSQAGYNFTTYLNHVIDNVTDKNRITKIIVGGGYYDRENTYSEIVAGINSFCVYCQDVFPKAQIYIACLGFSKLLTPEAELIRSNIKNIVVPAYSTSIDGADDPIYIKNIEKVLQSDGLIDNDNMPTDLGHQYIADKLYPYLMTNAAISNNKPEKSCNLAYNNITYALRYKKDDEKVMIQSDSPLVISSFSDNTNFNSHGTMSAAYANLIGTIDFNDVYPSDKYKWFYNTTCAINCDEGRFRNIPCTIWLRYNRELYISFNQVNDQGQYQTFTNVTYLSIYNYLSIEKEI